MNRRKRLGWFQLILGILLVAAGIFTLRKPQTSLVGITCLYGILAVVSGILDIVHYAKEEYHSRFGSSLTLVTGILSLIAGALLLLRPVLGTWVMVWSFPLWFIAHCIFSLGSLDLVRMTAGPVYYYFSLIINIIGLILGVFMILNPWAAWFSLSDLIGCYLLIVGIEGIVMALAVLSDRSL